MASSSAGVRTFRHGAEPKAELYTLVQAKPVDARFTLFEKTWSSYIEITLYMMLRYCIIEEDAPFILLTCNILEKNHS